LREAHFSSEMNSKGDTEMAQTVSSEMAQTVSSVAAQTASSEMAQMVSSATTQTVSSGLAADAKPNTEGTLRCPTAEEVQAYLDEQGITNFTGQRFWDFYCSRGWIDGKGREIQDWKAEARIWAHYDQQRNVKPTHLLPVDKQLGGHPSAKVGAAQPAEPASPPDTRTWQQRMEAHLRRFYPKNQPMHWLSNEIGQLAERLETSLEDYSIEDRCHDAQFLLTFDWYRQYTLQDYTEAFDSIAAGRHGDLRHKLDSSKLRAAMFDFHNRRG